MASNDRPVGNDWPARNDWPAGDDPSAAGVCDAGDDDSAAGGEAAGGSDALRVVRSPAANKGGLAGTRGCGATSHLSRVYSPSRRAALPRPAMYSPVFLSLEAPTALSTRGHPPHPIPPTHTAPRP